MSLNFKKLKSVPIIFIILVICFSISFYTIAWERPATPPGNNASKPLNVSIENQTKEGGLILNTGGAMHGLIVSQGRVGIGKTNPTYKLDVAGDVRVENEVDFDGCKFVSFEGMTLEGVTISVPVYNCP